MRTNRPPVQNLAARCALLVFSVAILWSPHAAGQQPRVVSLSNFSEQQSTEVRISGRSIVGAAVTGVQAPALTPELYLPAAGMTGPSASICVENTTVDGTYRSSGQIDATTVGDASGQRPGVLRFRYGDAAHPAGEANYRTATTRFQAAGLAVLAILGTCDGTGKRDRFVVVNRTGSDDYAKMAITLYVNTARADADLTYTPKGAAAMHVHCLPIQTTFQRIAYDATCTLTGPFEAVTPARLVLSHYGDAEPPLDFSLLFAVPAARP